MLTDPIQTFEHDRIRCSELVRTVSDRVRTSRRRAPSGKQLVNRIERLRDELFAHFAREEEGLFPFIVAQLPKARQTVDRLIAAHDAICEGLSQLLLLASQAGSATDPASIDAVLVRFNALYEEHANTEMGLLREIDEQLDKTQRVRLRQFIRGL
jgi:iron-sulfur cluster repair protein YtfE (RIC family)